MQIFQLLCVQLLLRLTCIFIMSSMLRWLLRQIMSGKCSFNACFYLPKIEKCREGNGMNTWGLKILLANRLGMCILYHLWNYILGSWSLKIWWVSFHGDDTHHTLIIIIIHWMWNQMCFLVVAIELSLNPSSPNSEQWNGCGNY